MPYTEMVLAAMPDLTSINGHALIRFVQITGPTVQYMAEDIQKIEITFDPYIKVKLTTK